MQPVAVIGGGVAGLAAALEAARRGYPVLLLEKEKQLGGWAGYYSCKATEVCQKCGACLAAMLEAEVRSEKGIELCLGCEVVSVKQGRSSVKEVKLLRGREAGPEAQGFKSNSGKTEELTVNASAVILAAGFSPFAAEKWPEYGYRRYPGVITSLDLEELWKKRGTLALAADKDRWERIAFVQCVGSRTSREGNPACSRVCCGYAWRMAERLHYELPQAQIDIFYLDLQTGQNLFSELEGKREIRLIRAFPSRFYQLPGEKVAVCWENSATGRQQEERYDCVVLSVGMTGNPLLAGILSWLDEKTKGALSECVSNRAGFVASRSLQEALAREGIFCAGSCKGPATIRESINDGRRAALSALDYLASLQ